MGGRLFHDANAPLPLHPTIEYPDGLLRTSWSLNPTNPEDPMRLVQSISRTFAGCRWLIARWTELRTRLEQGECWHSPEKLEAVRLLGRQPLDLIDDIEVCQIYLSSYVMDPQHAHAFFEVQAEMDDVSYEYFQARVRARNLEAQRPADATAARAQLLALVDRKLDRLSMLADQRLAFEDAMNALKPDIMGFDDSIEGERLRRHMGACARAMHRAIATIIKMRKDLEIPEIETTEGERPSSENGTQDSGDGHLARQLDRLLENDESGDGHLARQPEPPLENEAPSETINPDLQNNPTVADDEPQLQSAADVQRPINEAANHDNLGLQNNSTATEAEQDHPSETIVSDGVQILENKNAAGIDDPQARAAASDNGRGITDDRDDYGAAVEIPFAAIDFSIRSDDVFANPTSHSPPPGI